MPKFVGGNWLAGMLMSANKKVLFFRPLKIKDYAN